MLGEMAEDDLLTIQSDPDDRDLRAAVRLECHQVREARPFENSPR
jgi:hypothetical protein